jgi:hypothetical protein
VHDALDAWLVRRGATLAASMTKPRDWAYTMKVSLIRGAVFSAVITIDFMLSGMMTGNTPPK